MWIIICLFKVTVWNKNQKIYFPFWILPVSLRFCCLWLGKDLKLIMYFISALLTHKLQPRYQKMLRIIKISKKAFFWQKRTNNFAILRKYLVVLSLEQVFMPTGPCYWHYPRAHTCLQTAMLLMRQLANTKPKIMD